MVVPSGGGEGSVFQCLAGNGAICATTICAYTSKMALTLVDHNAFTLFEELDEGASCFSINVCQGMITWKEEN